MIKMEEILAGIGYSQVEIKEIMKKQAEKAYIDKVFAE